MSQIEPVVFHLHGSILRDKARLQSFYGKIGDGLAARGAQVQYLRYDRAAVPAQAEADHGFHIVDYGRLRHPRVLNAGVGYLRDWYYLDPWGMRAFSSVAQMRFDATAIDSGRARRFRDDLHQHLVLPRQSRQSQPSEVVAVPQGCIAVFLQTETHRDMGELCYMTLRHMIKALLERDDPRPIVVKPHPKDDDPATQNWLRGKARKDNRLRIVAANVHDILAACDVVVTINSAVGIEAMLHRKPVVLCGHADFLHCAVTLRGPAGMEDAIARAQATDWPYDAYLYWFFAVNGVNGTAPDLVETVIARIAATGFDLATVGLA